VFIANRTVPLSPFKIAAYETTYELWYEVKIWAGDNGYTFQNLGREGHDGTLGSQPTEGDKWEPVAAVSWRDAIVWCNAYSEMSAKTPVYIYAAGNVIKDSATPLVDDAIINMNAGGYRLPTEAEWEYAARGADPDNVNWGDNYSGSNTAGNVAWYAENADSRTHPVGLKVPNTKGLYDMSGNVAEWCWDWYAMNGDIGVDTPVTGPAQGQPTPIRVLRGGHFYTTTNEATHPNLKVTERDSDLSYFSDSPSKNPNTVGFRVVFSDLSSSP
jgi:formylglycine-generating enzyme required for sulfatase activity